MIQQPGGEGRATCNAVRSEREERAEQKLARLSIHLVIIIITAPLVKTSLFPGGVFSV